MHHLPEHAGQFIPGQPREEVTSPTASALRESYQRKAVGGGDHMSEDGAGNGYQQKGNGFAFARRLTFSDGVASPAPPKHAQEVLVDSSRALTPTQKEDSLTEPPAGQGDERQEPPPTQPDPPADGAALPAPAAKARPLQSGVSVATETKKVSIYDDGMYWKLLGSHVYSSEPFMSRLGRYFKSNPKASKDALAMFKDKGKRNLDSIALLCTINVWVKATTLQPSSRLVAVTSARWNAR